MKGDKIIDFVHRFCGGVIGLVMLVVAGFVAVLNFIYTSSVKYVWTEDVVTGRTSWVPIVLAAVLFLVFVALRGVFDRLDEKYVFLFFAVIYAAAGLYWVFNVSTDLRMDTFSVNEAAKDMLAHDFSFLAPGEYIYQNQHQLGMVTYEYLLGLITTNVRFLYFVNLAAVIGIDFVTWRLADLCFGQNHRTNLYTILFSFLFLPQFFFLAFAYGIIPGLFLLLLSFLFVLKYLNEQKRIRNLVLGLIFLVLSVMVKGNNIVGAVVIAILFFMHSLKEKKGRYLIFALAAMLCAGSVGTALEALYEWRSGYELSGGKPMILWIAMGTEPYYNNAPGWFNGYNDWAFYEAGYDQEKATEIAVQTLQNTAYTFRDHPDWMYEFFKGKMVSMWCDPMYESIWSGPIPDAGAEHKTEFLNELYSGGSIEPGIAVYMKAFMLVMFVLAFLSALRGRNRKEECDYICLYFIGGFLLHILWEAKSQYVYPYVFALIPCCAREMTAIADWAWALLQKKFGKNADAAAVGAKESEVSFDRS